MKKKLKRMKNEARKKDEQIKNLKTKLHKLIDEE